MSKDKLAHDEEYHKSSAKVITSPDGVSIQITAGAKWKFNRAVQRDMTGRYSKLQKQIVSILIDMTNEGRGEESRWGYAYPGFEKLAAECACTPKAAKENIRKLEEKRVLTVIRSAGQRASGKKGHGGGGGRDKSNMYFLHGWNEFGRVENGNHEDVPTKPETVTAKDVNGNRAAGNGNGEAGKGNRHTPDSSHHTSQQHISKNTHKLVTLAGAGSFVDEADTELVRTTDCMSRIQQFACVSEMYKRRFDRSVTDEDREAFMLAAHTIGIELMLTNIGLADRHHSFADCVNAKVWHPNDDPDASMQDEPDVPHASNSRVPPSRKHIDIDWENDPPF